MLIVYILLSSYLSSFYLMGIDLSQILDIHYMQWNLWAEQWYLQFVVTKLLSPPPKTSDTVNWGAIYDHRNHNACSSYDYCSDVGTLRNQTNTYVIGPEFWVTTSLVHSLFPFKKIQSTLAVCSFGRGKCWQNKEPLCFLAPSPSGNVAIFFGFANEECFLMGIVPKYICVESWRGSIVPWVRSDLIQRKQKLTLKKIYKIVKIRIYIFLAEEAAKWEILSKDTIFLHLFVSNNFNLLYKAL